MAPPSCRRETGRSGLLDEHMFDTLSDDAPDGKHLFAMALDPNRCSCHDAAEERSFDERTF